MKDNIMAAKKQVARMNINKPPKKKHRALLIIIIILICLVIGISLGVSIAYSNATPQDVSNLIDTLRLSGDTISVFLLQGVSWFQAQSDWFVNHMPVVQGFITTIAGLLGIFVAIKSLRKK